MKIKGLLLGFVLFIILFTMGCHSHRRHRTTVIVSDGYLGARIRYVGRYRFYHRSPCRIHNCNYCRIRIVILKDIANTRKYGRVHREIRNGRGPKDRRQNNSFGQRKHRKNR